MATGINDNTQKNKLARQTLPDAASLFVLGSPNCRKNASTWEWLDDKLSCGRHVVGSVE